MAGLVRRVPGWKIGPRRTRSQDPHHSVEDVADGSERSSSLRRRPAELLGGEEVLDRSPLLVGEVHGQGRSEIRPAVDLHRLSDRVPCTYAVAVMRRALGVGGVAVAFYRVLGRRFHFVLGFVAVLLVPLLSFGPSYEAVPLDLDDDEARAAGVPSWFIALWVWTPTPMPAGVAVAVLTALHWLVEGNEYRCEVRANASAESAQSLAESAPLHSAPRP